MSACYNVCVFSHKRVATVNCSNSQTCVESHHVISVHFGFPSTIPYIFVELIDSPFTCDGVSSFDPTPDLADSSVSR